MGSPPGGVETLKQQTLAQSAELRGTGLHSGADVHMTMRPAEVDSGIVFRRTDMAEAPDVPARVNQVSDVERGTVLTANGARVRTVEHLLAAVTAAGIDNAVIELDAEEPPAADGSAAPFSRLIEQAGVREQDAEAAVWHCHDPLSVEEGDARYVVFPDARHVVSATIEFDHPLIGRQHGSFAIEPQGFVRDVGPARTFGFYDEAERLRAAGLALGASVENTVVLTGDGLYEGVELRYADEFVRHKVLDLVGDLALLGVRIRAQIVAERPGHRGNIALARAIARRIWRDRSERLVDINQIFQILPHRYPFLLVDRVVAYERGRRIVGIKNVTINEPFFTGHFPGLPIMPGVLIVEAMAQVGGLLLMDTVENPEDKVVYFMALDKVKFRRPVTPGDQIEFELEMIQMRSRTCRMKGVGRVEGHVVAEAEMMAQVIDR